MKNSARKLSEHRFGFFAAKGLLRVCLLVSLMLAAAAPAMATNAYVQLKDRLNPLYITGLTIQYARMHGSISQAIIVLPEQIKYERFDLDQVRNVEFIQIVGERNMSPVYEAQLYLRTPGHWRKVMFMPIRELHGYHFGAPWSYPVDRGRGYAANANALQEIRFVPDESTR